MPEDGKEEIRLFTSLLDADEIPREEIADCYHERWSEETGIEEIKTRLGMVTTITRPTLVRSKTPKRVKQEVWALAHRLQRLAHDDAARRRRDASRRVRLPRG